MTLTYRSQLVLFACALVVFVGVVIFFVTEQSDRISTRSMVRSVFREVSDHAVTQTRDYLARAAPVAQSLARMVNLGLELDDLDKLAPQLLAFLEGNPGMTWVLYGDESGDYVGATRLNDGRIHIERTHMSGGRTRFTESERQPDGSWKIVQEDDNRGYDPRTRPFYTLAKEKRSLAWTPPYMFFSQGVPGISCVIPTYRDNGSLRGVFSVEFDLNALSEFVANLAVSDHSRVFLFTRDGTLLAHVSQRDAQATGVKGSGRLLTLADARDPLVDAFSEHLARQKEKTSRSGPFEFFEFDQAGNGYLASTTQFSIGGGQDWVVGVIAPQSDFLSDVWRMRWLALGAAAATLIVGAAVAATLAGRISRPVQSLIAFMRRVGAGDLEAKADFHGGREFRDLSAALNRMIEELRERLELRSSLQVAMDVQKSLLPAADPVTPALDVAGRSTYCDATGGDYYDFIDVSSPTQSSLLVAVGDVMGHGIPSALVMATARAALRTSALIDRALSDLLTRTNRVLAADNRHHRFMTMQLMLIDAQSRVVRWASAGHDPAILFDPNVDSFRELEGGDMPLGIQESAQYLEYATDPLRVGSVLVIGTDGIWEMKNSAGAMYGKQRLRDLMRRHHAESAASIAHTLEADLAAFRAPANSADDVTFVIIRFAAPPAASRHTGPGPGPTMSTMSTMSTKS